MISSPGCVCLGNATPGAKSTRTWMTSRPGALRSCRWRSVRLIPGCCARASVQRQTASDDQHRYRHDSSRFHVESPFRSANASR